MRAQAMPSALPAKGAAVTEPWSAGRRAGMAGEGPRIYGQGVGKLMTA